MNDLLEARVQRIFSDVFSISPDQLQPELSPDTIATWDSLNHLNLVLALEQEFGIQFTPEEAMEGMASFGKVVALLKDKERGH
jgi:acyl carrier protein